MRNEKVVKHYGLSAEQAEMMIGTSNTLVTACPGAGKTRSVAARAAWLRTTGKSVALISHTNVGANTIATAAMRDHAVRVTPESFVGTLHSFLGKYVLTPFGHHVTGSVEAVRMDEEAVRDREPEGLESFDYRFRATGEVRRVDQRYASPRTLEAVRRFKVACAADGVISFDDAMYWAYVALQRKDLRISQAIAKRFDEVLVDEAQDSSRTQLACLKSLVEGGLRSLVLVGDFDQAIYSFAGADPAACRDLASQVGMSVQRLRQNYRSSQRICDLTARFRHNGGGSDEAVGRDKDADIAPRLILYPPEEPALLRRLFADAIEQEPTAFESKAILARTNGLVNDIRGVAGAAPKRLPAVAKTLLNIATADAPLTPEDVRALERVLQLAVPAEKGTATLLDDGLLLRRAVGAFLASLPPAAGDAQLWLDASYARLNEIVGTHLRPTSTTTSSQLRAPTVGHWSFEEAVPQAPSDTRIATVHGVKGESIDAVMVAADPAHRPGVASRATKWAAALNGTGVTTEEQRIFYVAATRARRFLGLAIPADEPKETVDAFSGAGFAVAAE